MTNNTLSRDMMAAGLTFAYGDSPWPEHSDNKVHRKFGDGTEVTAFDMRAAPNLHILGSKLVCA